MKGKLADPANYLPLSTYELVHTEYRKLRDMAPTVGEALRSELCGTHVELSELRLNDTEAELREEIEDIEDQIESLEEELARLRARLETLEPTDDWPPAVVRQAGVLDALLRQYEGKCSKVLARLLPNAEVRA